MDILRCKTSISYCSRTHSQRASNDKPNLFKMLLRRSRWNLLTEIGMILTVFNKAIVDVQSPELALSKAFRIWVAATIR